VLKLKEIKEIKKGVEEASENVDVADILRLGRCEAGFGS
jgi:hypothetical protein